MSSATDDFKAWQRAVWASGDFPRVSRETVAPLGPLLVDACAIGPGDRVLDIASGSGNIAIPAALTGASVVASDLTPELFDAGRAAAASSGAELEWVEADAEALPFEDASFDVVTSCMGVMFAPNHQQAADELLRVARPGARIGLVTAAPGGWVAQFFITLLPYVPPLPHGASPPIFWGVPDHVARLFRDRVTDLSIEPGRLDFSQFDTPADIVAYYRQHFGPLIMAHEHVAGDPQRSADLDRDVLAWAERMNEGRRPGDATYPFEYMLITARRS